MTLAVRRLLGEIKNEVAVVQQQQEPYEEKQTHKKVEYAISLAARILNIIHQLSELW